MNTINRMNTTIRSMQAGLLGLFTLFILPGTCWAQELLIENAKILDPATQTVTEGVVTIVAGKIYSIEEVHSSPFNGPAIDLEGKWLMPGCN
ncbi:MAG: hypothetical protein AAF564_04335 [Bacteroidota bacterium]